MQRQKGFNTLFRIAVMNMALIILTAGYFGWVHYPEVLMLALIALSTAAYCAYTRRSRAPRRTVGMGIFNVGASAEGMELVRTPGKRIVSKGEYVAVQTTRTVLRVSSVLSLVEVGICVVLAVYIPFLNFGLIGWLAAFFCALMAFRFGRLRLGKLRLAASVEDVLPLTQTNAAFLPPVQTLVRASAPSPQQQQNVLLRATLESPATPADQLLRASDDVPHSAEVSALARQECALQGPKQAEETALWQAGEGQERHEEQILRAAAGE